MRAIRNLGDLIGGSLLIAATMVGVGMLGLPVATGTVGFIPASFFYILTWFFMLGTGLLLLEVCIWMPNEANLITMTHRLLGPIGKAGCWLVYLFLFLTAMIAHVSGGGATLVDLFHLPKEAAMILYVLIFSPIIYLGVSFVDRFNSIFMLGALVCYLLFIFSSICCITPSLLTFMNWRQSFCVTPVLLTAFTYQMIIPTLMTYMKRDIKKVRLSIIFGSSIPLIAYLTWELIILGIIPIERLVIAKQNGETAVTPLRDILQNPWIFQIGSYFAFFVLTTSYLALAISFLDFLADGLKIKKEGMKKVALCLGIFVPPTVIALLYPGVFITALEYAGGVSCALLFGVLPPLMVWVGRYIKKYERQHPQLKGGKSVLSLLIGVFIFELILQITS